MLAFISQKSATHFTVVLMLFLQIKNLAFSVFKKLMNIIYLLAK